MQISFAHRALILCALIGSCALAPTPASAAVTLSNWDAAQQHQVVKDGLMTAPGGSFQGAAPLSAAQANAAMPAVAARLGGQSATSPDAQPVHAVQIAGGAVTVVRFDALVVDQLGLADVASHVQSVAAAAGLNPPGYFGTRSWRAIWACATAIRRAPTSSSSSRATRSPGPGEARVA